MGSILSTDEKIRRNIEELPAKKKFREMVCFEKACGCHCASNLWALRKHHKQRKRNFSFYHRNDKGDILSNKNKNLDTIFRELSKGEASYTEKSTKEIKLVQKPLIPRIKLTRNSVKIKREYKLVMMSVKPDSLDSWQEIPYKDDVKTIDDKETEDESKIISNNQIFNEISKKPGENYFTKNFDKCMKRIHLLEKEHETMEKTGTDIQLFYIDKESKNNEQEALDELSPTDKVQQINFRSDCDSNQLENANSEREVKAEKFPEDNYGTKNAENCANLDLEKGDERTLKSNEKNDAYFDENHQIISEWYSNLKQQFEKNDQNIKKEKAKEMSCRITGATLKNLNDIQKMKENEKDTQSFFPKLFKSNKSLIDEELPDPDLVRNIRAKFQKNLNSSLENNLHQNFGGSLQNVSTRKVEHRILRPLSVQCNTEDIINNTSDNSISQVKKKLTTESTDLTKEFPNQVTKKRLLEKCEKDLKTTKDSRNNKLFPSKWTDSGSVSSGVSSDLSSYDTDFESYSKEGVDQEPDDTLISDDDLLEEMKDKNFVQNEILEKIRSFGTSVTYYGGEMITCSIGSLLSPTTQAIIQEINEKYGDENNVSRSFNEFYRKYVELNEPNKKRKIGRARSFGQNDVFHGPNVLNNTEIEMYKYDLEMEIGIRKPKGLSQSNLKVRLDKCNSLESREEKIKEKPAEISAEPPKTTDLEIYDKKEKICDSPITIVIDKCEEKDENDTQLTWGETRTDSETIDEKPEEKETSIQLKENKEEVSELPLNSLNMKSVFKRSQSAPHGVVTPEPSHESQKDNTPESFKSLSKEILFGYDKKLFNGKRKQDMEFEEFEICDSLTEKLEKLEEKNTSSCPNSNSDEINPLGISQTPSNSKMPPKEGTEQCSTEKIICNEENNNINYEDPIELGNSNKSLIIAISKEQGNKTQKEQEFDSSARAEPIETNKKKFLTEEEGDKNNNTSPPIEIEVNLQKSS